MEYQKSEQVIPISNSEYKLTEFVVAFIERLLQVRTGEPDPNARHDLFGAILFFLQEPEHFKKLEWSRSWSQSWHKLVRLQAPAVFKNFVKNNDF